jgi:site-specific DNA-cytosine methylase
MKILGLTSGIGSMMIGARGKHKILGNIEWRKYYHTGTFENNFPGSFMVHKMEDVPEKIRPQLEGVDLIIGHPECGNFSNLHTTKPCNNAMDIPLFMDVCKELRPKFFVLDNLPKSLLAVPMKKWVHEFPDYNIEFQYISNFHYGNTQKNRKRLFIIASLKELKYLFRPGEVEHDMKFWDVIKDLPNKANRPAINHDHLKPEDPMVNFSPHYFGYARGKTMTWAQFTKRIEKNVDKSNNIMYTNLKGERRIKIGFRVITLDKYAPTLTGQSMCYRADTFQPFTIRERARIQGVPDDFIFYPLKPDIRERAILVKQTGKCMPIQFCTFLVNQIAGHLKGVKTRASGKRFLKYPEFMLEQFDELAQEVLFLDEEESSCVGS